MEVSISAPVPTVSITLTLSEARILKDSLEGELVISNQSRRELSRKLAKEFSEKGII